MGSLDPRSSRALILSNMSAGTGSVLIRCRPEGICCDLFSFLAVCWKPSFAQFILCFLTISVPVCFL